MMISPEAYIDNIKDKSYKNLLKFMYLILILTISFTSGCVIQNTMIYTI